MEIETKIRKWGNSYGLILPKNIVEDQNLTENDVVLVDVKPKKTDLSPIFGICKFKKSTKEIMKEIRVGYDI